MFTWLFGDRGIPAELPAHGRLRLAHLPVGQRGRRAVLRQVPLQDRPGHRLPHQRGGGEARPARTRTRTRWTCYEAIDRGEFPSWTLKVQIMPAAEARTYRFNPFDLTKVWPHARLPAAARSASWCSTATRTTTSPRSSRRRSTRRTSCPASGRRPTRCCRAACSPTATRTATASASTTPSCRSTRPHARREAPNYGRDGFMRFDDNGGAAKNYEPNSFDGPVETGEPLVRAARRPTARAAPTSGTAARTTTSSQAGALYRVMDEAARARLVGNIAGSLVAGDARTTSSSAPSRTSATADPEYGARVADGGGRAARIGKHSSPAASGSSREGWSQEGRRGRL